MAIQGVQLFQLDQLVQLGALFFVIDRQICMSLAMVRGISVPFSRRSTWSTWSRRSTQHTSFFMAVVNLPANLLEVLHVSLQVDLPAIFQMPSSTIRRTNSVSLRP
jgi:hypothetical protein